MTVAIWFGGLEIACLEIFAYWWEELAADLPELR
jgi:hypothetical protein